MRSRREKDQTAYRVPPAALQTRAPDAPGALDAHPVDRLAHAAPTAPLYSSMPYRACSKGRRLVFELANLPRHLADADTCLVDAGPLPL